MRKYARRSKIRWRSREVQRQTVIVVAMAALLSFGLLQIGEYVAQRQRTTAGENVVAASASDDEIYTGSILFPTIKGRICHQLLFDNRTGRISDKGNVDCERAQYAADPKNWGASRARAISAAFRDR